MIYGQRFKMLVTFLTVESYSFTFAKYNGSLVFQLQGHAKNPRKYEKEFHLKLFCFVQSFKSHLDEMLSIIFCQFCIRLEENWDRNWKSIWAAIDSNFSLIGIDCENEASAIFMKKNPFQNQIYWIFNKPSEMDVANVCLMYF